MTPWWKNAIPHKDIREGRLDPAVFAIDLGEVVHGTSGKEYRDARTFFGRTYMTEGLGELLVKVLSTLYKNNTSLELKQSSPVIQLVTPFGGGKTHSLLSLYHVTKHYSDVSSLPEIKKVFKESGLKDVPATRVVCIDGTHLDPLGGEKKKEGYQVRTLWGEMAYQLGPEFYKEMEEHDQKMVSPGKQKLKTLLAKASPCLLILDELLEYVVKARGVSVGATNLGGQTMAFMQELTGVVAAMTEDTEHSCVLVATLPSSHLERYDATAENDYQSLKKITARIELRHSPVEGMEIYEILRRRLFDDIKNPEEAKQVATELHACIENLKDAVPKEFRDRKYREKIEKAYPFHPELIDILYEKWGALPGFQRTRGVLRFLATVISDLYKKNDPNPVIMPGLVDLGNRLIQDELLTYLEEGYSSVVDSDIGGQGSKCAALDTDLPSEFEKYQVATRVATLIFLHSVGQRTTLGVSRNRIRAATVLPDLGSPIINEAIDLMRTKLWYLYYDDKGENFYFGKEPGLNRIITGKMDDLKDEEVLGFVNEHIVQIAGDSGVYVAPEDSTKIPDTESLKYVFLSPTHPYGGNEKDETEKFCLKMLNEYLPTSPRRRKNTLIFVLADSLKVGSLLSLGRELLAYQETNDNTEVKENLSESQKKDLQSKLKDVASRFANQLQIAYSHVLVPGRDGLDAYSLGLNVLRARGDTKSCIESFLKTNELLVEDIEPSLLVERSWPKDSNYISTSNVFESFLKYTGIEMIAGKDVIRKSIAKGIATGLFGYGVAEFPEQISDALFHTPVSQTQIEVSEKAWLLRKELAEKLTPSPPEGVTVPQEAEAEEEATPEAIRREPAEKRVRISIEASNLRLTDVFKGVIKPLKDEGANLKVNIDIEAQGKFSEHTLKNKVKETLNQLGAKFKFEEE